MSSEDKIKISKEKNIQVFPTNDIRLKILGEIFSNESSRKILTLLFDKELTIMGISKESGVSVSLVAHHLKKMVESEIVDITKELKNSRGRPLRFYRAKPAIIVVSKDTKDRVLKSKSLKKIIFKITRFSVIGVIGLFTWIFSNGQVVDTAFKYPRPTLPPYMTAIEPQYGNDIFMSLIITSLVVGSCLVMNHFFHKFPLINKFKISNN